MQIGGELEFLPRKAWVRQSGRSLVLVSVCWFGLWWLQDAALKKDTVRNLELGRWSLQEPTTFCWAVSVLASQQFQNMHPFIYQ